MGRKIAKKRPAVFLDRDGTVCMEKGYLDDVNDLELIPGAAQAIRKINDQGWVAVIITNQSGVAYGYFNEDTVRRINRELLNRLAAENAHIEGIYYCPHHPEGNPPYNIVCSCRKPAPGMIYRAAEELSIDIAQSVIIGDKFSDIQTAQNLGIRGIWVLTGYGQEEYHKYGRGKNSPDIHVAEDLKSAIDWWFREEVLHTS
ncbi:MAG: D-glycero-beta-D-manno-heptose 1,7-bisphosphate 7-phosphatase [Calditrichia bacterium]